VLAYQVDQIKVVLPSETEDLLIVNNQDYATLLTCTPYGVNTHRLLVRGHRIPYEAIGKENSIENRSESPIVAKWEIIAAIGMLVSIVFLFLMRRRKKKKLENK
ncbi:sortase, partial [Bacillus anthracis]